MFVTHSFTKILFKRCHAKGKGPATKFHEQPQIQHLSLICVISLFYNEDPTYLKVVNYFFFAFFIFFPLMLRTALEKTC